VDVSEKSLAVGSARYPVDAEFRSFDGKTLPFPDETFDLAFVACVFHHIAAEEHVALLRELYRVLRSGGIVAVFEHNPLNPVTVRAVNTCPFDENAILIPPWRMKASVEEAGFRDARIRFRLFVPGLLRRLRPIEAALYWCPLGAQYSVMGAK
jgi:SAM-dependent methyltransferase